GPGFPVHAPSVYAIHAFANAESGCLVAGAGNLPPAFFGAAGAGTGASSVRRSLVGSRLMLPGLAGYVFESAGLKRMSTRPSSTSAFPRDVTRTSTRFPRKVPHSHAIALTYSPTRREAIITARAL